MTEAPDFTRYPLYDEIGAMLHGWAEAYPHLVTVEEIGRSWEGRPLWSATVTDTRAGAHSEKPAIYVEGNIHAGEVLPSVVSLYTIWDLISRADEDEAVADLLRRRTFYVRPRVAPDGAEHYLTTPDRLRSAAIPWPHRERQPGLHPADVNGDGQITLMRIPDEHGEWRVSERDERIMVRCGPDDQSSVRYRLLQEGTIVGPVGPNVLPAPPYWGLDFNRAFPHNWQPEHLQAGAGPYPLYAPETRATADFFLAHPNIGAAVLYHTAGGFVFHLPSSQPAGSYQHGDLTGDYRTLTNAFTEMTGQPGFQSYEEETNTARCGSLMDWAYSALGIYTWVPELWDIQAASGAVPFRSAPFQSLTEEEEATMLRWADEQIGESAFVRWTPFDHPQLGRVEIGGWTFKFTHQNCPPHLIPSVARPVVDWSYLVAQSLPELEFEQVAITEVDSETWLVEATVLNAGFLPTNISEQALEVKQARPVNVTIEGEGINVLGGSNVATLGHLQGSSAAGDAPWRGPISAKRRGTARFFVHGSGGAVISLTASSPRAGVARKTISLSETAEAREPAAATTAHLA